MPTRFEKEPPPLIVFTEKLLWRFQVVQISIVSKPVSDEAYSRVIILN